MQTPVRTTNALAVVSLVAGILGWSLLPFLGSVIAIVTGHLARAELRRNPDTQEGDGFALAGLILGYLAVAMAMFTLMVILFFFGGLAWFGMHH